MNSKLVLGIFLSMSFSLLQADTIRPTRRRFRQEKPQQCYCSVKCGPRDVKEDDTPFIDPETGICFCQQRDKDLYEPNNCKVRRNTKFPNSICSDN